MCNKDDLARVRVRAGWMNAGRAGRMLGPAKVVNGTNWTPVVWDDEDDPEFFKTAGLEGFYGIREEDLNSLPVERCGVCEREFGPYSTPYVNTANLLSPSWICWRCAGVENPSKLPAYDPDHVCGVFCDGQDGRSSRCAQERRKCASCRRPAGVHGRDDRSCKSFIEKVEGAKRSRKKAAPPKRVKKRKPRASSKHLNVDVGDAYHDCPSCGWMGKKPCPQHAVVIKQKAKR